MITKWLRSIRLFQKPTTTTGATGAEPTLSPTSFHSPKYVWLLDAGHGLNQPGKHSPLFVYDGQYIRFYEWWSNWDMIQRIRKRFDEIGILYYEVNSHPHVRGQWLDGRIHMANKVAKDIESAACLFVSWHSNAYGEETEWTESEGIETFYFPSSRIGEILATKVQRHLSKAFPNWRDRGIKTSRHFAVLRRTTMPAILIEWGFFNNRHQVIELLDDNNRERAADAFVSFVLEVENMDL
jgi:N-acetylmuramoyl-L-alanine amidase